MNIIQLYQDYNIPYSTSGKNVSAGWVGVKCPFCGDHSDHMGFNLDEQYYSCWRCGTHFTDETIAKLIGISLYEARKIIKQYDTPITEQDEIIEVKIRTKAFKFPSNVMPLQQNHKRYLEKRGFDPDYLEKEWGLLGTGPISKLDDIDYKHRIIIPFEWDGKIVSFDSRDITNKHRSRYMACPAERELISHKNILYGKQEKWRKTGICVEGPTDVWRLSVNAFATSGIKYTNKQVREMAKSFERIAVVFDDEEQAISQANRLVAELKFRNVDAFRVDIEGDPGSMKQEDANYLVKQLIK